MDSFSATLAHCRLFQSESRRVGHDTLVILGSGYTARFILPLASSRYTKIVVTSREPDAHLTHVPNDHRVRFDLSQADTWRNIPEQADLFWCFPAAPLEAVQAFAGAIQAFTRRVVVLGSTSAYDTGESVGYPPPWLDETAPVDLSRPRVQGEEYLRRRCGAIVLRVAGIYGPGRNPIEWIRTGRVNPTRKYVNLIHVEDLAAICLVALERGVPGEIYNVSDGTPRTWQEICATAQARWGVTPQVTSPRDESGKRLSTSKLRERLGYTIQHPDLYEELAGLP